MGSVLLVIHLMVAILLVVLILMQRNTGNALSGLGGGNGADSFLSARGKGNLLTRTTAIQKIGKFGTVENLEALKGMAAGDSNLIDTIESAIADKN